MLTREFISESLQILTEAAGHMDHPEDMVMWGGIPKYTPLSRAIASLNAVAERPQAVTIKIDGWPALIFGSGPDGRFAILDKHMFNSSNQANRAIYSPQDFAQREAARGEKARMGLAQTVAALWKSLEASYSGNSGWYMGDLVFYPNKPLTTQRVNTAAGPREVYQFQANPEGLMYRVPVDSDLGEYLSNKVAGIAIHRHLPSDAVNTEDRVTWLAGLGNLRRRGNVALLPVRMPVTPDVRVNQQLKAAAEATLRDEATIVRFIQGAPGTGSDFANRFTTYVNGLINNGTLNARTLDANFDKYFKLRLDAELAKGKISQKRYDALIDYYESNRQIISKIWANWMAVYRYKMSLLNDLNAAAQQSPLQGYLRPQQPGGSPVPSQEGFVSGGIKLVDRLGFSRQNAQARLAKQKQQPLTEDRNGLSELVIYPGGFHPFHLGHASVFDHLAHHFPDGEVFVAATDTKTERPFGFDDKKFLANQSGVPKARFVQVKSPYRAEEITKNYDPDSTMLVFAVSEKDSDRFSFAPKKDGSPAYFQPYDANSGAPMSKHAYIYIVPKIDFKIAGKSIDSASKIRQMYTDGDEATRAQIIRDLYPLAKAPKKIRAILDRVLGGLTEADIPPQGSLVSPIPGTPDSLQPRPSPKSIRKQRKEASALQRFMGHR